MILSFQLLGRTIKCPDIWYAFQLFISATKLNHFQFISQFSRHIQTSYTYSQSLLVSLFDPNLLTAVGIERKEDELGLLYQLLRHDFDRHFNRIVEEEL